MCKESLIFLGSSYDAAICDPTDRSAFLNRHFYQGVEEDPSDRMAEYRPGLRG